MESYEILQAFQKAFGIQLSQRDVDEVNQPFNSSYAIKSLESRYAQGMSGRATDFANVTATLRHEVPTMANNLLFFVLEARKSLMRPTQMGRSASPVSLRPGGPVFTPENSSTASYAHSTLSSFSSVSKSPFDRNDAARVPTNLYYRQETPPVRRRIPRPGDFPSTGATSLTEIPPFQSPHQGTMKENILRNNWQNNVEHPLKPPMYTRPPAIQNGQYTQSVVNPFFPEAGFESPLATNLKPLSTPNPIIATERKTVPMRTLITEVLHAMKGLSGSYIRSDGDQLRLSSAAELTLEMWACTSDFILMGNLCAQLPPQPPDGRANDLFKKAFHHSMFLERNKYLYAVDQLTAQVASVSDDQAFYFVNDFASDWEQKLRCLVDLWTTWKSHETAGFEIVDTLLEKNSRSTNGSTLQVCLEAPLHQLIDKYLELLNQWILNGKLHEYSGKWLIKAYKSPNGELDVMGTYRLDRIPSRFRFYSDPRLAQKILEVGRLIGCLGGAEWDGWDDMQKLKTEQIIDYNDNQLVNIIQEIYSHAGNDVKRTLVKRDHLFEHLEIVSNVFFLLNEQFSYQLFNEIRLVSNQFSKIISAAEAASVLVKAATANGIISRSRRGRSQTHFEVIAEVGSTPRDSIRRNYVNTFNIKYKAASGLAACVLSRDALLRYQNIFQTMWSIQFVSQGVTEAQRSHLELTREIKTQRIRTLYPLINTLAKILAHVHSAVYALAYYASDVCEYAKNRLRARLDSAIDLSECITQHDKHLKLIEERLFLDTKLGSPVTNCLGPLIDDAIAIFQHYTRFSADLKGHFEKWATSTTDDSFVRIEQQFDIEEDMLSFQREQMRESTHLHAKFKDAQTKLFQSLIPYGDMAPMSNLRECLI
ncbi:unnamed protein product, partial [Mesorhabditis belari]|uniref:Gamma-tubulin complex component n=1 Tax=Mesorhabditis belari TaxID=2138241 RepID=A0AAF3EWX6_9BILA